MTDLQHQHLLLPRTTTDTAATFMSFRQRRRRHLRVQWLQGLKELADRVSEGVQARRLREVQKAEASADDIEELPPPKLHRLKRAPRQLLHDLSELLELSCCASVAAHVKQYSAFEAIGEGADMEVKETNCTLLQYIDKCFSTECITTKIATLPGYMQLKLAPKPATTPQSHEAGEYHPLQRRQNALLVHSWPPQVGMQQITVEVDVLLCPAPEERPCIGRDWEWLSPAGQKQEGRGEEGRTIAFRTQISAQDPIRSLLAAVDCHVSLTPSRHGQSAAEGKDFSTIASMWLDFVCLNKVMHVDIFNEIAEQLIQSELNEVLLQRTMAAASTESSAKGLFFKTELKVALSVFSRQAEILPRICTGVGFGNSPPQSLYRLQVPIGVSLWQTRQLLRDAFSAEIENDDDCQVPLEHEDRWHEMMDMVSHGAFHFMLLNEPVERSQEAKYSAIQLAVLEGSKWFRGHSQSEALLLSLVPTQQGRKR